MTAPPEPRIRTAGKRAARFLRHHPATAGPDAVESNGSGSDGRPAAGSDALTTAQMCRVGWIDLRSVGKIAFGFYLAALVVFLVAVVVLWMVAAAVGVVGSVERFVQDLGFEGFRLLSGTLLLAAVLLGLAAVVILTVATVVAASFYNAFARAVGGLEVLVSSSDVPSRPPAVTPGAAPNGKYGNGSSRNGSRNGSRAGGTIIGH
jgi:hypothetical protein